MRTRKLNDEVLVIEDEIVTVNSSDIKSFKDAAEKNQRKRVRFCAHKQMDDRLHEMFIVLPKGGYIRPHKHMNKSESFHIIEGRINIIIFDEKGSIIDLIEMGDQRSGKAFYYRFSSADYHTPLILSGSAVFHETTNGPFNPAETVWAPWAPDDKAPDKNTDAAVKGFMDELTRSMNEFISKKGRKV